MEFYEQEPFGDEWRQLGTLAMATLAPYSKKRHRPEDFYPFTRRRVQSHEEIERALMAFAAGHNAVNYRERS